MSSEGGTPQLSEADRKIAAQQAILRGIADKAAKQTEQEQRQKIQAQINEKKKMEHDRIVAAAHMKREKEREAHRASRKKVIQPLSSPRPKLEPEPIPVDPKMDQEKQQREAKRKLNDDRRKIKRAAAIEYATTVRNEGLLQQSTAEEDAAREEIRKSLYSDLQTKYIEELRHKQRQEQSVVGSVKRNFISRLPFFKK